MRGILHAMVVVFASTFAFAAQAQTRGVALPVPSATILQGDVVSDELLTEQRFVANDRQLAAFHTSREGVIGKVARRVLPAGHAIPINALREPHLFKEGERIAIVFATGGLSIEASGIALQPGVLGSMVSVRNADTGVVVRGVVQDNGSVQVGGK
jgi:flagella basal body P-ring formation protein FlgA